MDYQSYQIRLSRGLSRGLVTLGLAAGCLALVNTAVAETKFSVQSGIRHEDNIGLSPNSGDEVSDQTLSIQALATHSFAETATQEFSVAAGLYADFVMDTDDISHRGALVKVDYTGQANTDITAVFWNAEAQYQWRNYDDSDIRDGQVLTASAAVGKRFSPKFSLRAGVRTEQRRASDSSPSNQPAGWDPDEVFDLSKTGFFIRSEFDVRANTQLFAEFSRMSGDVAANGRSFNNGTSFTRAWDRAFGPGYIVWKIDVDQNIFDVGVVHEFNEQLSLDASISYLDVSGESNNNYKNLVYQVNASYRF